MQVSTVNNKYSAKYFPDGIKHWEQKGNFFFFYTSETILEVQVLSDKVIRFRYAADGMFHRDFSYAVVPDIQVSLVSLSAFDDGEFIGIITKEVKCFVSKENLKVRITDHQGLVINEDEAGFHWQHYLTKGGKIVYCSKRIQEKEVFYGLGDKPTHLQLRGKRLENFGTDAYAYGEDTDPLYKNIPFYYGLHQGVSYGIFFDNTFRTIFDFGQEREDTCSYWARGGEMCYYFIYGPQMIAVAEQYAMLTGTPELPPLWALGYHQCRWSYFPDAKVKEIAMEFRKRNIPCDVMYLDIDYMEGFRCFTFSNQHFPEPKALTKTLEDAGFKTVVIIDPGIKVDPTYDIYLDGLKNDVFCKRQDGAMMEGDVWPGKCVFPDFTSVRVREWWSNLFGVLIENGVAGVWNDMNEPAVFEIGTFPEDVRHDYDGDPCSHRKAHNIYGHLMAKATWQGLKKFQMPKRPFVITRSAYCGIQKWSSVWTGDNTASWQHLHIASQQCQRLSISGISFAGSDVGGFIGEPDGELYTRWVQMAAFHPFMRTHSASNETGFDQEPWSFGASYENICKKFIQMRYRLLPYLYTTFYQNMKYGTPMLRPLVFMDQRNPETHQRNEEFMLGDHLLVCPVVQPGQLNRNVYLPSGGWYHNWDDRYFKGSQEVEVPSPLKQIPLFIREGAVIPTWPQMQYVGEKVIREVTLHIYYKEGNETSWMYMDDGDNMGYKRGQSSLIKFEIKGQKNDFKIWRNAMGSFPADRIEKYKFIVTGLPFKSSELEIDGKAQKIGERNRAMGKIKFTVDKNFHTITIK
jgi:alpha-glucosidase